MDFFSGGQAHEVALEEERESFVGDFARGMGAAITVQVGRVASEIEAQAPASNDAGAVGMGDETQDAYAAAFRTVFMHFAALGFLGIHGGGKPPDAPPSMVAASESASMAKTWLERVDDYLAHHGAEQVTRIDDYTREIIRDVTRAGVQEGRGSVAIAEDLRKKWEELKQGRAERIARTEVMSASNRATMEGAESTGLNLVKIWHAHLGDGRTRDDHVYAHGQRRFMDEPFHVGGAQMQQPGDGTLGAGPEQIVNCRCAVVFEVRT